MSITEHRPVWSSSAHRERVEWADTTMPVWNLYAPQMPVCSSEDDIWLISKAGLYYGVTDVLAKVAEVVETHGDGLSALRVGFDGPERWFQ